MTGGAGDDLYFVESAGDEVIEALDGGIDTVATALEFYSLGGTAEIRASAIRSGETHFMGGFQALVE